MILNKHTVLPLFSILLIFIGCSEDQLEQSSNTVTVQSITSLGGSKNDSFRSVISTTDGGYAVLGFSQSNDGDVSNKINEQYDYWLLKFDSNDQQQWQRSFGGSKDDRGEKIIQTNDSGYALIGFNRSADNDVTENAGFQDVWLLKLDALGNIVWQKSFGFSGTDQGFSVLQTSDSGYLISGILDVTASGGQGNKRLKHAGGDYWALKLDQNGNLLWRNYFGGTNTDTCYDAIETNDGYVLIGSSDSNDVDINNNKGSYDYWMVKIDLMGQLVWEKSLGGNEIETAYQILNTSDGNFILVGETRSSDQDVSLQNGGADAWIIKLNPNGGILWERSYGGSAFDVARSITIAQDGGYLIAGSSRSQDIDVAENKGQNDAWVFKIASDGKLLWEKSIGGSDVDFAYGITQLQNGSIIAVGDTNSSDQDITDNKGFTDALIIKIDEE